MRCIARNEEANVLALYWAEFGFKKMGCDAGHVLADRFGQPDLTPRPPRTERRVGCPDIYRPLSGIATCYLETMT
jgi:hypothetical protein